MSGPPRPLPIPRRSGYRADLSANLAPSATGTGPSDVSLSDDARSTAYSRSDTASIAPSIAPSTASVASSRRVAFPDTPLLQPSPLSETQTPAPASVPADPLPDSLLCRSTFAALEHSAGTLKRLAKHVLDRSSEVMALLEQVEKAEDEMLAAMSELGRWLEGGYGVKGEVWEDTTGMRKVAREKRRREKEDLEAMVVHSLEAVKGEIKRQGLAGNGAQARFEVCHGPSEREAELTYRALQSSTTPKLRATSTAEARRPRRPIKPKQHGRHSSTC